MPMEMADRSVVVTGGASGIGKATARLLAREGALVLVGDIAEAAGQALAAEAAAEGLRIEFLPLDLANLTPSKPSPPLPAQRAAAGWMGW